tara:strand:- start:12067 stop:12459 length:393 start_codon:yes stop_codon:yes gene_type:complete
MKNRSYYQSLCVIFITITFSNIVVGQNASITINENKKISEILALKKNLEAENKLTVGYTIQLYYGELNEANKIIREYRNNFDSWPASIEYETPNYKVWIGSFSSRFEADRARLEIKDKFPSAFILKPDRS